MRLLPDYINYGMSFEQYWYGPAFLKKAYREAYRARIELKSADAWLQGLYIYEAYATVEHNKFSKRPKSYPEKPYRMTPLTEEEQEAKRQEELQKLISYLDAKAEAWNKDGRTENHS